MSFSISTSSTAPSSDGAVASAATTKGDPSDLPFEAILEDQTEANREQADVCDGDLPIDLPASGVVTTPVTAQTAIDPLAGLPSGFGLSIRRLRIGEDDVDASILRAIGKDTPAHEAASLLLLAVQDVLHRLEARQPAALASQTEFASAKNQIDPIVDDQLPQDLLAAFVSAEADPAHEAADAASPATADPESLVTDLLIKEAAQDAQSDHARVPDVPFSRPPSIPPGVALVDAIRLTRSQGTFADLDKGFNQPSTTTGFDRQSSKTGTVPTIHVAEAVGFNSAVTTATSTIAVGEPLPNEDGVVSSIVQTMRLQMRDGIGTAVVHLEPDYMGAVSIALRVENGMVTASLHAENPQVRAWMEANEPLLRESLAGQGLSLDRLLVTDERIAGEHASGRRRRQAQEQQARPRPRRDNTKTFEVVV